MIDHRTAPFAFPAVARKKLTAAFDGGRLTSDDGVMLLAAAERRLGLIDKLAALFPDPRDPSRVVHRVADILLARGHGECRRAHASQGRGALARAGPRPSLTAVARAG